MKKIDKYTISGLIIILINVILGFYFVKLDYDAYMISYWISCVGMLFIAAEIIAFRNKNEPFLTDSSEDIFHNKQSLVRKKRTLVRILRLINMFFTFFPTLFIGIHIVLFTLHFNSDITTFLIIVVVLVLGLFQFILRLRLLRVQEDMGEQQRIESRKIEKPISQRTLYSLDLMIIIMMCLQIFLYLNKHINLFDDRKYGFGLLTSLLIIIIVPLRIRDALKKN